MDRPWHLYDRLKQLVILSSLDESPTYGIDESYICFDMDTKMYSYINASGCSCWDGSYYEDEYMSLDELIIDSLNPILEQDEENRYFRPSYEGVMNLIKNAKEKSYDMGLINNKPDIN